LPTIQLLDLVMSLDSNGEIAAQVTYTLEFSETEIAANISFEERVALVRRIGVRDAYSVQVVPGEGPGVKVVVTRPPNDAPDEEICVLIDATLAFDSLGVPHDAPAKVQRSFRRVLSAAEVSELLEVGREHPYAVVTVLPMGVTPDVQLAQVEVDVGDPSAGQSKGDFPVGTAPVGVVFDGTSIWVTNSGSDDVTKLGLDGNPLGTFKVGKGPSSIAFDGTNIWVGNTGDGTITPLDASSGSRVGSGPVGGATAIAVSGTDMWVAFTTAATHGSVSKVKPFGSPVFWTTDVGSSPSAIAYDGELLWVANEVDATVSTLHANDGLVVGTHGVGAGPVAVAYDGENLWVANSQDSTVTKLLASDGSVLGTYPVGANPVGIAVGTDKIWVSNSADSTVTLLRPSDGSVAGTIPVGKEPTGIAYDGDSIWVACRSSDSISKRPG
jgi:hypothetical protein